MKLHSKKARNVRVRSEFIQAHIARYNSESRDYDFLALLRSGRNPVYPNVWQVVTGKIESGETAAETARREVREETNLKPGKMWTLPYVSTFYNAKRDVIFSSPVFGLLVDYNDEVILSPEHTDFRWLGLNDCIDKVLLPSHKEGTEIFNRFVLSGGHSANFEINL